MENAGSLNGNAAHPHGELITAAESAGAERASKLQSRAAQLLEAVQTYPTIEFQEMAVQYAAEMLDFKTEINAIEADRHFFVDPMNESLDRINARFRSAREPLEECERLLKGHIAQWKIRQRLEVEQMQRELEAQAQAERDRLQAQAAEKEQAARAAVATDPVAALQLTEQATALNEQATMVPTEIAPEPPKLDGVTMRYRWVAEYYAMTSLVDFLATHHEWVPLVKPDQSAGDAAARSLKGKLNIPGVRAVQVPVVAGRTK